MMDSSLTSAKSTPFSINDILTKTNSAIFRRSSSSDSNAPMPRKSCSENRDCDHVDEATDELSQHLANQMRLFKYSAAPNYGHNQLNSGANDFLYNNNHSSVNNNHGAQKSAHGNDTSSGRHTGDTEKTIKAMRFYNFPLVMEHPLDMRRCNNDDDSGE